MHKGTRSVLERGEIFWKNVFQWLVKTASRICTAVLWLAVGLARILSWIYDRVASIARWLIKAVDPIWSIFRGLAQVSANRAARGRWNMTYRFGRRLKSIFSIKFLIKTIFVITLAITLLVLSCLFLHLISNDSELVFPSNGSVLNRVVVLWKHIVIGNEPPPIKGINQGISPKANGEAPSATAALKGEYQQAETPRIKAPKSEASGNTISAPSTSAIDTTLAPSKRSNDNSSVPSALKEAFTFNDLLTQANNLLVYFSILVIFITLLVGVAGVKLLNAFRKMEHAQEIAETAVLESALITLAAVPLIEASQQTSDTHCQAIDKISETVDSLRKIVLAQSRYAPLLVVEGLCGWKDGDLDNCRESLIAAYHLAHDKSLKQTIAFHLARCFKQLSFKARMGSRRRISYLEEAEYWADYASSEMRGVIRISLAQQEHKDNQEELVNSLGDIFNLETYEQLRVHILSPSFDYDAHDLAENTALVVLATSQLRVFDDTRKKAAHIVLRYFQRRVSGHIGSNLAASFYYTMARLANILIPDDLQFVGKKREYIEAAKENMKWAIQKGVTTFFVFDSLAEESQIIFNRKIDEAIHLAPGV